MKITLTSKRNGILKSQINTIVKEIERLQKIYTGVEILELGGFDETDEDNNEAEYIHDTKTIRFNKDKARNLLNPREYRKQRDEYISRVEKRKSMGIDIGNDGIWNNARGLISTTRHEFGHAICFHYGIDEDEEVLELYESLSEEEITNGLAKYATKNVDEFLAVAFEESFNDDATVLAMKIREIIDRKAGVLNAES